MTVVQVMDTREVCSVISLVQRMLSKPKMNRKSDPPADCIWLRDIETCPPAIVGSSKVPMSRTLPYLFCFLLFRVRYPTLQTVQSTLTPTVARSIPFRTKPGKTFSIISIYRILCKEGCTFTILPGARSKLFGRSACNYFGTCVFGIVLHMLVGSNLGMNIVFPNLQHQNHIV